MVIVLCYQLLCLVILLTSPYDEGKDTPETNFYGCICDAGSSSTRVSVYTWPQRKSKSIPVITEIGRTTINFNSRLI